MMVKSGGKNRNDIVAGDILCAKSDGSRYVFDAEDASDISLTGWTPIGVVVIPPSHDVYGTGEGAAVSLKYMSYDTSDEGSTSAQCIYWGQYSVDTSLNNFNQVNVTDNKTVTITTKFNKAANLPSDNFTGIQCDTDPTAYYINILFAPSPYLSDGSRNEDYYTTEYTEYNALSDFDGIGNTNILCSLATAQSDWRTATTINNNSGIGYSPAACCCWRYHTIGTNQGDWYLPAAGELGYLTVRLKTINTSINNIGGVFISTDGGFWSSSEDSSYYARGIYNYIGQVSGKDKDLNTYYVRSFIRF